MDRMENVVNIACFIHSVDIELLHRFFNLRWNHLNFKEGRQYSALLYQEFLLYKWNMWNVILIKNEILGLCFDFIFAVFTFHWDFSE